MSANWHNVMDLPARRYTCGFCGNKVATKAGFAAHTQGHFIYICPFCSKPTYFGPDQVPGVAYGDDIERLPDDIAKAYAEARRCMSVSAYTAATLICRKVLMHIAVAEGDTPGKSFAQYVEYLEAKGFVPPNGREWVDHIRKKGNEATHEIPEIAQRDAQELITFLAMLLTFIYEFPARLSK